MLHIKKMFIIFGAILCLGTSLFVHAKSPVLPGPVQSKTYLVKPDYRKCAFPMCGGYFLTLVNQFTIQLEDETKAYENSLLVPSSIYVSSINYRNMGLKEKEIAEINSAIRSQRSALIQGNILRSGAKALPTDTLVASAVWLGANNNPAYGSYLKVSSSGIVCITSPCPSFLAELINTRYSTLFDAVNLEKAELNREQEVQAWQEISTKGLVMTGVKYEFDGFAGKGLGVAATKVFFSFPSR